MKKFLLILFLSATFITQAIEPVTVSYDYSYESRTMIPPSAVGDTVSLRVVIHHWEYSLDEFSLAFNMPQGLELVAFHRGRDLDMVAFGSDGCPYTYCAPLVLNGDTASCKITDIGYEDLDGDGTFDPYGSIKFLEGNQEILFIDVRVLEGFEDGTIVIDGYFNSTGDLRIYTPVCGLYEVVSYAFITVSYDRGDVNGDGKVTIADVTALIDKLMNE